MRGITSKHHGDFCYLNLQQKTILNHVKNYAKIQIFVMYLLLSKNIKF